MCNIEYCNLLSTPSVSKCSRFGFFRFIVFAMNLDITYVYVHSKIYESRKVKLYFGTEGVELMSLYAGLKNEKNMLAISYLS